MKNDYLAIIHVGSGSAYGRDETIESATENALRALVLDFGRYYTLEGKTIQVLIYDVTGYDSIQWDYDYSVYSTDDDQIHNFELLQKVTVTLPELKKRQKLSSKSYLNELRTLVEAA